MQTIISSLAFTFMDDAVALLTGCVQIVRDVTGRAIAAAQTKFSGPINRLARTCDVAGVLPEAPAPRRKRIDMFGTAATLRALRELT